VLSGPHQPQVDIAHWTSKTDDTMNLSWRSIDCKRDYSSLMKASEFPWMGFEVGDPTQILTHLSGIKTQNSARLPEVVQPLIFDRFEGRYVL